MHMHGSYTKTDRLLISNYRLSLKTQPRLRSLLKMKLLSVRAGTKPRCSLAVGQSSRFKVRQTSYMIKQTWWQPRPRPLISLTSVSQQVAKTQQAQSALQPPRSQPDIREATKCSSITPSQTTFKTPHSKFLPFNSNLPKLVLPCIFNATSPSNISHLLKTISRILSIAIGTIRPKSLQLRCSQRQRKSSLKNSFNSILQIKNLATISSF